MPRSVKIQHLRPNELDSALRECPIMYLPFGLVEWHGPHLPLGVDSFTAEAVAEKAATISGGLAYPISYVHCHHLAVASLMQDLFLRLKKTGFRVIVVITCHNGKAILEQAARAARYVCDDGNCSVVPIMPGQAAREATGIAHGDHAARNETSLMMHLAADDVDMSSIDGHDIPLDMSAPYGIGGEEAPQLASAEHGAQLVQGMAEVTAKAGSDALQALDAEKRSIGIPEISMEHWWMI